MCRDNVPVGSVLVGTDELLGDDGLWHPIEHMSAPTGEGCEIRIRLQNGDERVFESGDTVPVFRDEVKARR